MRIWLIGADQAGSEALRQFQKNPAIEVFVTDMIGRPRAVTDGVIARLDAVENVTPMNVNALVRRIRPDLILIDSGAARRNLTRLSGGTVYAEALQNEIAATAELPCITI